MWNENDFQLIDCSRGEKLERWGAYYIIRPDPQAIWNTERRHPAWYAPHARYSRSRSGGGSWSLANVPPVWHISYNDLRFYIKLMNFKHTGIFPEQAANWDFIANALSNTSKPRVLNLFAYTGAASLVCAANGASVCHVDAARAMVAWARDNAALSGLASAPIRWIVDDCVKFVAREIRRGNKYDAIIMDPPSFGRGPAGELWRLEDNLFDFVSDCLNLLSDNPLFLIINSYTSGFAPSVLKYIADSTFTAHFGGSAAASELTLPVAVNGFNFPCGSVCRWIRGDSS